MSLGQAKEVIDAIGGPSMAATIAEADKQMKYLRLAVPEGAVAHAIRGAENTSELARKLERDYLPASVALGEAERLQGIYANLTGASYGQQAVLEEQERIRKLAEDTCGVKSALNAYSGRVAELSALDSVKSAVKSYSALIGPTSSFENAIRREGEVMRLPVLPKTVEDVPYIAPYIGPTFEEVLDAKDRREEKRHEQQMELAKRVVQLAEENDRRSAENDRREQENDRRENAHRKLTTRLTIIFGLAGVVAAVWLVIVSNVFG
jgi:hypothetical protein